MNWGNDCGQERSLKQRVDLPFGEVAGLRPGTERAADSLWAEGW